ncbi:cupin domain-containing protein [Leeuwenhoekiella nanhaiensis]|uniref:Cupin n=1 Tax=Leeuwenhoekiella nanhaiensis TaxID=1655491 RepID=A0A2G1VRY0_9FLAO|nr:cupin domain-containing protein [Leeuwenhoekiella nanhaiensis]PHQ29526.1 cupin [Leeuwenhoekiella nanhaiensis]
MSSYFIQKKPFVVPTDDGKYIGEHFGKASTGQSDLSIAHMVAPPHWSEPFQTPEFDEYTFIISGQKQFDINGEQLTLKAGESIQIKAGTRVRYSNPFDAPCTYISVCKSAFDFEKVNREAE